jgi:GT2 family glycosyltransferase
MACPHKIDVSIVIVNYNLAGKLLACLESLFGFDYAVKYEVIVVDNASTDHSIQLFSHDERLSYFYLSSNCGFGSACNYGSSVANGDYLFFLNPDTLLTGNILDPLYKFYTNHASAKIGAIGSCLKSPHQSHSTSFGEFPSSKRIYNKLFNSIFFNSSYVAKTLSIIDEQGYSSVDFVSGANMFISRVLFDSIGGFDRSFFMYYEETDLQLRLAKLGYSNIVIGHFSIIHQEGASFMQNTSFQRKKLLLESQVNYILKHFRGLQYYHIFFLSFLVLVRDLILDRYKPHECIALLSTFFKVSPNPTI